MITSRENPQVKAAVRLRESAKERQAQGLFFLEGVRLCRDALNSGYEPQTLFVTKAAQEKYHVEGTLIAQAVAQKLCDTKTPQGVFGVFAMKAQQNFWRLGGLVPGKYIALENVQDPGNLGGIARTAEALGLTGLILSGGCDLYHPKALRASMGSLLRLPVLICENFAQTIAACGLPCYAAVLDAEAKPIGTVDFNRANAGGAVICIGNEGSGLSEEAAAACEAKITVPMRGNAESLNAAAAAAILIWELVKP